MRKTLSSAGLIVLAAAVQAILASLVGVPPLHWWQWSAINAPVVGMGVLLAHLTEK